MNEVKDRLLRVADVAKVLSVNTHKVYDVINAGLLPHIQLGGIRVRASTLDKFMADYEGYDLSDLSHPVLMSNQEV